MSVTTLSSSSCSSGVTVIGGGGGSRGSSMLSSAGSMLPDGAPPPQGVQAAPVAIYRHNHILRAFSKSKFDTIFFRTTSNQ